MSSPLPEVGAILAGQFRLDDIVGRGGFGVVYRARDLLLDRTVAVKVAAADGRAAIMARFQREARFQGGLRHPAIVQLLHYGHEAGTAFMVQEFVEGRTLKDLVEAEGPLHWRRAARHFAVLLDALDTAHAHGVVHRDLKPGNIMLESRRGAEVPRLLDFGIAKVVDDTETDLTGTGMVLGTPAWMAPEQALRQSIGPALDIYSLGCVLYFALSGRRPFDGSPVQVAVAHVKMPPPPMAVDVPTAMSAIVTRAMAKRPRDRFASARAMRSALLDALGESGPTLDGHPMSAPGTSPAPHARADTVADMTAIEPTPLSISDVVSTNDAGRRSVRAGTSAAAAGLVAALVVWSMWPGPDDGISPRSTEPARSDAERAAAHDLGALDPMHDAYATSDEGPMADAATERTDLAPAASKASPVDGSPAKAPRGRKRLRRQARSRPRGADAAPNDAREERIARLESAMQTKMAACECARAQRAITLLREKYGVDHRRQWQDWCAPQPSARCAVRLSRALDERMKQCPCISAKDLVERLERFGISRERAWYRRCVPSPLPMSCPE